jgi:hypothetical protein
MIKSTTSYIVTFLIFSTTFLVSGQPLPKLKNYTFTVINMIPSSMSSETNFDREPGIAVNPANSNLLAGSAFTLNPKGDANTAPIYVSTDGGFTWKLNNILPSTDGMTHDITLAFGNTSGALYAGIIEKVEMSVLPLPVQTLVLRTNDFTSDNLMTTLVKRDTELVDQPFLATRGAIENIEIGDKVFVGDNNWNKSYYIDLDNGEKVGGDGKTAEEMILENASAAIPSYQWEIIEQRDCKFTDMPPVRTAIHSSGVVYAAYYNYMYGDVGSESLLNVVVLRDDHWALGSHAFNSLNDPSDGKPGSIVAGAVKVLTDFSNTLGGNRFVVNLAIAVDPNNSSTVYVAWSDETPTNNYTLHLRRSTTAGATWLPDLLAVPDATNPGLAINDAGLVGFVYQQLVGLPGKQRWVTHFRSFQGNDPWTDDILSNFPADIIENASKGSNPIAQPILGDYLQLKAVGLNFYGVFPAANIPEMANFPSGVIYQRYADWSTHQLYGSSDFKNTVGSPVNPSVDPFFFRISPSIQSICDVHPEICGWLVKPPLIIREQDKEATIQHISISSLIQKVIDRRDAFASHVMSPFYHLYIDDFDSTDWKVELVNEKGDRVGSKLDISRSGGLVLSFRIQPGTRVKNRVPNYYILLTPRIAGTKKEYRSRVRLEVSNFPRPMD